MRRIATVNDRAVRPAAGHAPPLSDLIHQRLSRRTLLKAGLVVASAALAPPLAARGPGAMASAQRPGGLTFTPIGLSQTDDVIVPPGYRAQVLIRWGDPLAPDLPPFDVGAQTAALQERRFGFNNDFLAYLPLPWGSGNAAEGLLWANHEYTDGLMMFPDYERGAPTAEQAAIELAAHGGSVVHLRRAADGTWRYDPSSPYNRRLTATTPMRLSGPAAGDPLLQTSADPTGTLVLGMLNNCAGGVTPWGTVLTCEENFNNYFGNLDALPDGELKAQYRRYGIPRAGSRYGWERHFARFDVSQEPHEPNRFGWVVELDPYDPSFQPVKRTALGRFKHEGATVVVAPSGQVVVYSGDDERFEYVYKFVSAGRYVPGDRAANLDLLDEGILYVARFDADGTGEWLPLVFGHGPLVPANGWRSQADVLLRARQAASALGATPLDRPEDVEASPVTGKVYMVLTYNEQRGVGDRPGVDAANPRADNRWGHIIEWTEAGGDPTATRFQWEIFLLCGDPTDPSTYFAGFDKAQVSPIAAPDNVAFDAAGNLWIATDGIPSQLGTGNDGVFVVPTEGPERGHLRQFLSGPVECEICGPEFAPDGRTFFCAIQHPGEGGSLAAPLSVWPSGPSGPARPSVVAVTRADGGPIGQ
jgi:secreted PhoX family phosphatase